MNNVKQFKKYCHEINVTPLPPHPIVVNNIICLLCGKLGALKINNYLKNPIVIYGGKLFEKN
jgi:hypothetical protein